MTYGHGRRARRRMAQWRSGAERWRDRVFLSRRDSILFGVCGGIAEYYDVPAWAVRAAAIALAVFTAFTPVIVIYIILALAMKKAPDQPFETYEDEEFWNVYQTSRAEALRKVSRAFEHLDERIQRMERVVTSRDFDLEDEYRRL